MKSPFAVCPDCGRLIRLLDTGTMMGRLKYFKRHRVGKGADLKGGQTPATPCPRSLMVANQEVIFK